MKCSQTTEREWRENEKKRKSNFEKALRVGKVFSFSFFFRPRVFRFSPLFPFNVEGVRGRKNMYTQHGNCEWYSRNRSIKLWEKQNMFAFHWTTQLTSEVHASNCSWESLFLREKRAFPMENMVLMNIPSENNVQKHFFSFFETIVYTQFSPSKGDCAQMPMYITMKQFAHAPPKNFLFTFSLFVWKFHVDFSPVCFHPLFFPSPSFLMFLHRISFREKVECFFVFTTSNIFQPVISCLTLFFLPQTRVLRKKTFQF